MASTKIRESVIAGSWYPGDPKALTGEINRYLEEARTGPISGEPVGLVVPHAGYMYSGGVAAHAYKLLRSAPYDRVLIVAPSHRVRFSGASVNTVAGYRTPLGVVPVDNELTASLLEHSDAIEHIPRVDDQEHSLEIQLPFLQVVLEEFQLIPIVMGDQSYETCRKLAEAIGTVCKDRRVLLVASTDLSHYHAYREATTLDRVVLDRVAAFDPAGLSRDIRERKCEACGGGPMVTVMLSARILGASEAKVLRYANSGDVTGDTSGVVGYMAAAFLRGSRWEGRP